MRKSELFPIKRVGTGSRERLPDAVSLFQSLEKTKAESDASGRSLRGFPSARSFLGVIRRRLPAGDARPQRFRR